MITTLIAATLLQPALNVGVSCHDHSKCAWHPTSQHLDRIISDAWTAYAELEVQAQSTQEAKPQETKSQEAKLTREQQNHANDLKSDVEIGKQFSAEADKELKASTNQEYIDRVNRIGQELANVANANKVEVLWGDKRLNTFQYHFKVVQNKEVNAFSLPGGYIYVFEGLLDYVESDDELAGVLAHEISHGSFRHMATLVRERGKLEQLTIPLILVALAGGRSGAEAGSSLLTLQNFLLQAKTSGWGQDAERAADYGAFQYVRYTNYSPVGMLTFLEKLGRDQRTLESIDWGIYRTHPPSRERATLLEGYFKKASIPIRRSKVSTSFRVIPQDLEGGKVELRFNNRSLMVLGGDDAKTRAEALVPQLNAFFDEVPDLFDVSMSDSGRILWRRQPLIQVTPADADAAGKPLGEATTNVLRSIKREIYVLAYRIWDTR